MRCADSPPLLRDQQEHAARTLLGAIVAHARGAIAQPRFFGFLLLRALPALGIALLG